MRLATGIGVVLVFCSLAVEALPVRGEEAAKGEGRKVVASATATNYVRPDSARLSFVVTTTEPTDKSAREANEKQVKKIQDALAALPLGKVDADVHVLPSSISTLVNSPQAPGGPRTVVAKRAQSIFQVTVREKDLTKLRTAVGRLAEAAVENGATGIQAENSPAAFRLPARFGRAEEPETVPGPTIEWMATAPGDARREAIRRATKEALADAEAAAGQAKLKVLEIDVSSREEFLLPLHVRDETGGLQGVRIPIRVQVRVTCSY